MPEERRNEVHGQRFPLLQPGSGHKRRRSRKHRAAERERNKNFVDEHEPKLGAKLAIELCFGWAVTFV